MNQDIVFKAHLVQNPDDYADNEIRLEDCVRAELILRRAELIHDRNENRMKRMGNMGNQEISPDLTEAVKKLMKS